MREDLQFRPVLFCGRAALAAAILFGSGLAVSASGQTPAPPPQTTAPSSPATAAAQVPGQPIASRPSPVADGTPLAIEDAVKMALENNLGIQTERLNPQIQTLGIARAQGAFKPSLFSNFTKNSNTSPPTDFLSAGVSVATSATMSGNAGVQQQMKWGGGAYQVSWDAGRFSNDAPRQVFQPQLTSDFNLQYTQPLLRNFKIDAFRQQLMLSLNAQDVADIQLQQRVVQTSRSVRAAYYNLVGAIASLDVAQQSLDLARQSLSDNQRRVEVGTMAPIDIVAAQAEVASNEENVIVAEAQIQSAEDQLRTFVMNPTQPGFWTTVFKPTEQPVVAPISIDVEGAVKNALEHRTDLLEAKKQMEATNVNMKFAANQKLPGVNVQAAYGATGVGGTQFEYDPSGINSEPTGSLVRPFSNVLRDVFGNEFRQWSVAVNVNYPLGMSTADATFAQNRIQLQQQQTSLGDLQMQVATSVRQAARNVTMNLKRVEATRRAREFAEQRLEAEQKRFTVGLVETFELFQAQRDLAVAKRNELAATIDYNRSVVDFEAVQIAPVGVSGPSSGGQ